MGGGLRVKISGKTPTLFYALDWGQTHFIAYFQASRRLEPIGKIASYCWLWGKNCGWCLSCPTISHGGHKLLTHLWDDGCGSDQKWCGRSAKSTAIPQALWALFGHRKENTHTQCGFWKGSTGSSSWMDVTQAEPFPLSFFFGNFVVLHMISWPQVDWQRIESEMQWQAKLIFGLCRLQLVQCQGDWVHATVNFQAITRRLWQETFETLFHNTL